jgi:hypothetical protein
VLQRIEAMQQTKAPRQLLQVLNCTHKLRRKANRELSATFAELEGELHWKVDV